ncbi:Long-chain fatty acid transport protein precursor [Marinomonas spartinae]|uniref:OmpP1/FadL family transporter n=1 Tax=Marinomonas spartinae TaxID=1792290 RepID=UPI0008090C53|nr:outer membrane protein transport protein [Marinomonas spartinae]SBS34966.1 Long-chain fatty acid transport protein precursor [Marinomonas spartinae]
MTTFSTRSCILFKASVVALAVASASSAYSAGFALNDHSTTASGSAIAGAAASGEDISFSYWNPALFLNAKKNTFYVSGAYVMPKMDVTNIQAKDAAPTIVGGPTNLSTSSTSNSDSVDNAFIPAFYYAMPLSDDTVVGVSLNAPFGLSGDYGNSWPGRFHATETSLKDVALAFSVAHRVNDWFSAGASVQVHRAHVVLASAVGTANPNAGGEGLGKIKADATGYGFSLGVLMEPIKGTRIGIGYRSKVKFDFKGDVKYDNVAGVNQGLATLGAGYQLVNASAEDNLKFPDVLTISLDQALTNKLRLGLSAIHTGWSSISDGLNIKFGSKQPNSVLTFGFDDEWMYSAGLTYDYSEAWTLRTGIAMDNSPVTDKYRSARTPDGDRKWYSLGATYHIDDSSSASFAYTYVSIEDVSVNRDGSLPEDASRGTYKADYASSANVVSLAYTKSF